MITSQIAHPMNPSIMGHIAIGGGHGCWPSPGGWPYVPCGPDAELERLRRLEREASREQEKEAIRQRLRRMGVPDDQIAGYPVPYVYPPLPLPIMCAPSLETIIRQVQAARQGK